MGLSNVLEPHSCVYVLKLNTVESLFSKIWYYTYYVLVVSYIVVIYAQKSQNWTSCFALFQFLDQFNVSRFTEQCNKLRTNTVFPVVVISITTGRLKWSDYIVIFLLEMMGSHKIEGTHVHLVSKWRDLKSQESLYCKIVPIYMYNETDFIH